MREAGTRYKAVGIEADFEPGSRGRVLRNRLGITRVRDINLAESQALELAQRKVIDRYQSDHRFTADDVCDLHRIWLADIYDWAGEYRHVDLSKDGFRFAHAQRIPALMRELERGPLKRRTPCAPDETTAVAAAMAEVHAELILVHPFREGNGRAARLLTNLMALQAGLPPLDYNLLTARGKAHYVGAIHAAMGRDYSPMTRIFSRVIKRTLQSAASSR